MASTTGTPLATPRATAALLALLAITVSLIAAGSGPSARAASAEATGDAVRGEIVVRFTPGTGGATRADVNRRAGVAAKRDLLLPGTQLVRTLPGVSVPNALAALNANRSVRYAEPNWIYRSQRTPNDPLFGDLWNLHNTGQSAGGIHGTPDADVSAPEAWDNTTGSHNVKVAVVDYGIDYFHPDLAVDVWQNPGEGATAREKRYGGDDGSADDDGNGFGDDFHGWDFFDGDEDPIDTYFHGTAVSSVIGAVGDNALGITGVNWDVSLVAVRACGFLGDGTRGCPLDDVADGIWYAREIGADVVNLSLGRAGESQILTNAIAGVPELLVVAASGNAGTDNDAAGFTPCTIDLPNIICVTGTDNRDGKWEGANYGATTVDLGAPAVDVEFADIRHRAVFTDNFDGSTGGWDYTEAPALPEPGKWRRTAAVNPQRRFVLEDSEVGNYPNDADTRVTLKTPIDLSGERGCFITVQAAINTEGLRDYLRIEGAKSAQGPYRELLRLSGDTGTAFKTVGAQLDELADGDVYLRLRLTSDSAGTDDGATVDLVQVWCENPVGSYGTNTGTSLAAPHVAGAAALVKSVHPDLSALEIKQRILDSVDPLPSLAGKTVTGGRLNLARAVGDLSAPAVTIDSGPADVVGSTAATFGFSSESGASFECRLDDQGFASCSSPKSYAGLADGAHRFEVRARDQAGNVSEAVAREWTIDTAAPAVRVDSGPPSLTNSSSASFAFSSREGATFECRRDDQSFAGCVSPRSYTDLADGGHRFEVRARDAAGNVSQVAAREWTIDTAAPTVTISERPASTVASSSARFVFSSSEPGAAFECRLDAGSFASCTSPREYAGLADGEHAFEVRAIDAAGNVGAVERVVWTIDTTAPDVAITDGPSGSMAADSATFAFSSSEAGSTFECRLDAGAFAACASPKSYDDLAEGAHSFAVRAINRSGVAGEPAAASWSVDTTAPGVVFSDAPPASTTSRDARFAFAASEPVEVYQCSLDGAGFAACLSPVDHSALAPGSHTFAVRARDAAGHWTDPPAALAWTVTEPPADGDDGTPGDGDQQPPPGDDGTPPGQADPVLPPADPAEPAPNVFDPPVLRVSIAAGQRVGRVLRRGLVSFASVEAACPCRLEQTLRLSRRQARAFGLATRGSASGRAMPTIGAATLSVTGARRVRVTLELSKRARVRLRPARRLKGTLRTKLIDRHGRTTQKRSRARLRG